MWRVAWAGEWTRAIPVYTLLLCYFEALTAHQA
jgi:hypothetical protein